MSCRQSGTRNFVTTALAFLVFVPAMHSQSAAFEVASVKPTNPNKPGGHALNCSSGTGFVAKEQNLVSLIEWAYDIPHGVNRVRGGPDWLSSPETTFEVIGKVDRKVSFEECRQMLQTLLADRFEFAFHWETRELPVYMLTFAKKGPKLHRTGEEPDALSSVTLNGARVQLGDGYRTTASGRGMSMPELARFLSRLPQVGRPVIDATGLQGFYGFSLDYAMTLEDNSRPDIFAALPEQLGLKLESAKSPVQVIVVDHAEKPSGN
jgi:uncharacterized protein (TIGR03435 family)